MFCEHSNNLKDGTYIFVAKQSLIEATYDKFKKDFKHVVSRSRAFKEN